MITRTLLACLTVLASCVPDQGTRTSTIIDSPDASLDALPDAPPDALPDAAVDAPPDAPPPPVLNLSVAWSRTILIDGASTGLYRGADGTSTCGTDCYVTGWEQGGISTMVRLIAGAWTKELVAQGMIGPEDAKAGDLGRGVIDVVTASDAGKRLYLTLRGTPNATFTLPASQGHGYVMQVAIADIDSDGLPDIVFGTRGGTPAAPAVIAFLKNPGVANISTPSAWTYHQIGLAGWVMSLYVIDGKVVVSDRTYHVCPTGSTTCAPADHLWDLSGARWLEQTSPGVWLNHMISAPAGQCPANNYLCTVDAHGNQVTPGDEMFLAVDGNTVYDCQSKDTAPDSRIMIHRTTDWVTWTHEVLPAMPNVGHCQGVVPMDVGDGRTSLVVTTWKGNTYPVPLADTGKSGVYLLHPTLTGGWKKGEITTIGGKFDNWTVREHCGVTSEQLDPDGGIGVVMYCPVYQ